MSELTLGPIGQIARAVKDLAEAERFYRDVLGLQHLFTVGKLAFFDCGGVRLMIEDRSIVEAPDLHNDSVLYFRVQDIHAAQQELERRGVTFTGAPHMIYKHPDGVEEWLDYPRILKMLNDAGYNGCLSIVYEGKTDALPAIEKAARYLRSLLG